MASWNNVRGALLEEILLFLLRQSGYRTIENPGTDRTLRMGHSGLEVVGRGERHQIDAVADYMVAPPFSYAQRLLVEAKCYRENSRVGIDIVRNAVGVLKDVSEYLPHDAIHAPPRRNFVNNNQRAAPQHRRYHYQYALFSTSGYTENAQRYAFAQDIFLIPLARSPFFKPITSALFQLTATRTENERTNEQGDDLRVDVTALRYWFRMELGGGYVPGAAELGANEARKFEGLENLIEATLRIGVGIIGMISRQFPVFLVPENQYCIDALRSYIPVSIHWNQNSWYLRSRHDERVNFSFDLPDALFKLYARNGRLDPVAALNMKQEAMSEIQALVFKGEQVQSVRFELDPNWLQEAWNQLTNDE